MKKVVFIVEKIKLNKSSCWNKEEDQLLLDLSKIYYLPKKKN